MDQLKDILVLLYYYKFDKIQNLIDLDKFNFEDLTLNQYIYILVNFRHRPEAIKYLLNLKYKNIYYISLFDDIKYIRPKQYLNYLPPEVLSNIEFQKSVKIKSRLAYKIENKNYCIVTDQFGIFEESDFKDINYKHLQKNRIIKLKYIRGPRGLQGLPPPCGSYCRIACACPFKNYIGNETIINSYKESDIIGYCSEICDNFNNYMFTYKASDLKPFNILQRDKNLLGIKFKVLIYIIDSYLNLNVNCQIDLNSYIKINNIS